MVPDKNRPLLKSTTAKNITNTAKGGTIYNPSKDILNFADREIGNVAIKITNITVDNTLKKELSRRPPFLAIPSKQGKLRTKTVNTTATVR
ncbi:hypothetical protein I3300191I4_21680 [Megasphaera elsdenii]